MHALSQLDLPLQPPAPAPEAPVRSGGERSEHDGFAETLQRSTAGERRPAADRPRTGDEPTDKPADKQPDAPRADGPAKKQDAEATTASAADTTDDAATVAPAQVTPADEVLAALAAMTVPSTAPVVPDDAVAIVAPVPVPTLPVNAPTTAAVDGGHLLTPEWSAALQALAVTGDEPPTGAITLPTVAATGTAPATTMPMASADLTQIAASTPVAPTTGTSAMPARSGESPATSAPPSAPATDLPVDALLAPVATPGEAMKPTTLPTTTPGLAAQATTQPAGLHAVASALGDAAAKREGEREAASSLTVTKAIGEFIAPPQAAQTAPLTPNRPLSETVAAQAQLAQQGNAMEKSVSQQVSRALVQQLPNGDRMMVVRLTPPDLGTVKVELIERQGVFSARLHAEDDGVRLALERFLPAMRQDLRASDAPIRELTLSDQAQFHRSFADGQQHQHSGQDGNRPDGRRTREDLPRFNLDGVRNEPAPVPRSTPLGGRIGSSWVDARA